MADRTRNSINASGSQNLLSVKLNTFVSMEDCETDSDFNQMSDRMYIVIIYDPVSPSALCYGAIIEK